MPSLAQSTSLASHTFGFIVSASQSQDVGDVAAVARTPAGAGATPWPQTNALVWPEIPTGSPVSRNPDANDEATPWSRQHPGSQA